MKYLFISSLLVLGIFLVPVESVVAQGLVPCEGGGFRSDSPCTPCHLIQLANNVITWLISILTLVFAILAMYAGFKLVTSGGNTGAKQDAKSMLTNAIIGFILVLAAFIIIDTGMRALLRDDENAGVRGSLWFKSITCDGWSQSRPDVTDGDLLGQDIDTYDVNTVDPTVLGTIGTGNTAIVAYAQAMDAKQCLYSQRYRNGCNGNPGYTDCSDLVNNAFRAAGCRSPGTNTSNMYPNATAIGSQSTLRPGDSIVYRWRNSSGQMVGHVVICMDDGCTRVIHAQGRGAPDGRPATIPAADQITISNSSSYLGKTGARVLRAADYCN